MGKEFDLKLKAVKCFRLTAVLQVYGKTCFVACFTECNYNVDAMATHFITSFHLSNSSLLEKVLQWPENRPIPLKWDILELEF